VRTLCIFLLFVISQCSAYAQADDWEQLLEQLAEEAYSADSDDDIEALDDQIDELTELHEHPLDLNVATREQLSSLPFLTDAQVDAIFDYRSRYGAFRSEGELRLVPELGSRQLQWLRACTFISYKPVTQTPRVAKAFSHEVMTRLDVPLYEREGWPWAQGMAHRLRYTAKQQGRWDFGLRGEKDSGEPMFNSRNPLWDAWGAHAMLENWRFVERLIIGDYKVAMGEGLVINNGFQLGKQLTSLWRRPAVLRPHRSAEENRFLRGAGVTLRMASFLSLTALYSFRKLDATVQADNSVQTINSSGLHRTPSELARRRTLGCHTTAVHLAWDSQLLRLGASAMYQYYDHQFRQGASLYRQIYPEGYQFGAVSADYALRFRHFYFSGETARSFAARTTAPDVLNPSSGSGWATVNKASLRFSPNTSVTAVQRFYSRNYFSALASAYGENGRVQNESGVALLVDADRVGPFGLRALVDYFYSPWPRYTMTRASHGFETAFEALCNLSSSQSLVMRYSFKSKERSDRRRRTNRMRLTYAHTLTDRLNLQASVFATHVAVPSLSHRTSGIALVPRINYSMAADRLRCSLSLALFATGLASSADYPSAAYDSRLYLYEPSLFQSFGMISLYGKGERLAASTRWQLSPRWQLQAKCGLTHYRDRDVISSGVTMIKSRWRTDLQLLARWLLK